MQAGNLHPNDSWPLCLAPIPVVNARVYLAQGVLCGAWKVRESALTFRSEVGLDGGPCWHDSCVEIFVRSLDGSGNYCNFEFTPQGFCLAARGPDRNHRLELSAGEYARIVRNPQGPVVRNANVEWSLQIEIPLDLLGLDAFSTIDPGALVGNIYKCGDKTQAPHWLSAFPIDTPKPDFHRPEFFQALIS